VNTTDDTAPEQEMAADLESEPEPVETSGERTLDNILEALLLASEAPLSLDALQRLVGAELNIGKTELRVALHRLAERLGGGATELREVGSGWRIQVRRDYAQWVGRLWQEKPPKLSRATLETLALIVYRQPITRGEIEEVRGVAVSPNILRTLVERGWVRELGHKEVPGRPALFGTTQQFLDDFQLKSLDQLPSLPEIKDIAQLDAALARLTPGAGLPTPADAGSAAAAAENGDAEAAGEGGGPAPAGEGPASDVTIH
jgi:segregation and condensation protein B